MTDVIKIYAAWAVITAAGVAVALCHIVTRRHGTPTRAVLYDQDNDRSFADWPELAAWERDIRTPGHLEACIARELGT